MREFDEFKMDANPKRLRKTNPSNAETTEKQIEEDSSSFNNDKEVSHVPTWLKVGGILFTGLVIPGLIGTMVYFATTSSPTPYRREQSDSGSGVCYTLYPDIVSWDIARNRCQHYNLTLPDPGRLDLYQDLALMTSPLSSLSRFPQVLYSGFWVDKPKNQSNCNRLEFNIEPSPASTYLSYKSDDCYEPKPLVCQRNETDTGICREQNYAKRMLPTKLVNYLHRSREAAQTWNDVCYSVYRLKVEYEVAHLFCSQIKSYLFGYDENDSSIWQWIYDKYSSVYPEVKEYHLWTHSKIYPPCKAVKMAPNFSTDGGDVIPDPNTNITLELSQYYCQRSLLVVCQGSLYEPCPGEDINDLL